ncbi:MAG: rhomboid family intramembrane serine protease [Candidatus Hadarchaeales archaeon]
MFPIKDENPARSRPILTYALIAANVGIFLLMIASGSFDEYIYKFGMRPAEILKGINLHTVLTSIFLHGGILHIVFNMWYLWIFGDNVEDRMGRGKFIAFYLAAGVAGGISHALSDPSSSIPTIGASGAISGVLGAYVVFYPWANVYTAVVFLYLLRIVAIPALIVIGAWFALQLLSGSITWLSGISTGTAYWAHIGGFIFGLVVALIMRELKRGREDSSS